MSNPPNVTNIFLNLFKNSASRFIELNIFLFAFEQKIKLFLKQFQFLLIGSFYKKKNEKMPFRYIQAKNSFKFQA